MFSVCFLTTEAFATLRAAGDVYGGRQGFHVREASSPFEAARAAVENVRGVLGLLINAPWVFSPSSFYEMQDADGWPCVVEVFEV